MAVTPLPGAGDLDLESRETFNLWTHEIMRFGDTDAVGHINNGAFTVYFENGRIKSLLRVSRAADEGDVDWVIARLCIDFRRQLFYPGEVDVGTRVAGMGRASLQVAQAIFDDDGRCAATAMATMVLIDKPSGRATPIPEAMRARIADLLPG